MRTCTFLRNSMEILAFCLLAQPCLTATWYVDSSVATSGNGTSWETAFKTIQEGVATASDGDAVVVADGMYTNAEGSVDFQGKAITLRSQNGPAGCILDCEGNGRGFFLHRGEDQDSVIDGFTVTHAYAVFTSDEYDECGGGILCANSSPTITNCVIRDNLAYMNGGGIYCLASNAVISNCSITGNTSEEANGGGIACVEGCNVTITNCVISGNEASGGGGGGLYCRDSEARIADCYFTNLYSAITSDSSAVTLERCTIAANRGTGIETVYGGGLRVIGSAVCGNLYYGVYCVSSSAEIVNCTISANQGYGIHCRDSNANLFNSVVWANSDGSIALEEGSAASVRYCDIEGGFEGQSNMASDPLFVALGHWDDAGTPDDKWDDVWVAGDFRLRRGSPCIDAGDNEGVPAGVLTDLAGNPRFLDDPDTTDTGNGVSPVVDMGAYEFDAAAPSRVYVDAHATGANNGTSWADAFNDLQDALDLAAKTDGVNSEVWVAAGTYKPDRGTGNREATFQLLNGVAVYGGFAGFETRLDQRAIVANETILSGDLLGNDGPDFANNDENVYHVITSSGTDATAVLDGFTMTGGNANGDPPHKDGGGVYNEGGSPTLRNCTISGNSAEYRGSGMCNCENANPTLANCTISGNRGRDYHDAFGPGMYNYQSSPTLTNCTFSGNSGSAGGGMYNYFSNPSLTDCTFAGNSVHEGGGGMRNLVSSPTLINCVFSGNFSDWFGAGGMEISSDSTPVLTNCTFTGNSTPGYGGGVHTLGSPTLTNCTIGENTAERGGGIYTEFGSPTLVNCLIRRNSSWSDGAGVHVEGGTATLTACRFWENSTEIGGGGAVFVVGTAASPTFVNCVFSGNWADGRHSGGGAILTDGSNVTLTNCTLTGNATGGESGGILGDGHFAITNCILWGNVDRNGTGESSQLYYGSMDVNYSCVQGWTGGLGGQRNIGANPLFVNADGPDDIPGTEDDNLRLRPGSRCIDAGDNAAVPPAVVTDLDGNLRFMNDPHIPDVGSGTPPIVDMGAYEFDPALSGRLFADAKATGANNGTTWADAFTDLQDAMDAATAFSNGFCEIWVAAGTYRPDREAGDRDAAFQLLNWVEVYGGFAGDETDLDQRDPAANQTILSGDLASNDAPDFANNDENSYHVVTGSGTDATAVLDGFTIAGGNASGGGGMYNEQGSPTVTNCMFTGNSATFAGGGGMSNRDGSNPMVSNCTFIDNRSLADWGGGGMFNYNSSPTLIHCVFRRNLGEDNGGGVDNWYGSSPILMNCAFIENRAGTGAGVRAYGECSLTLINCTFTGNTSSTVGGGICVSLDSSAQLANCLFLNNSASSEGGGAYGHRSNLVLTNCTLTQNSAQTGAATYIWHEGTLTLTNCILWGNTASQGPEIAVASTSHPSSAYVSHSDVQGGEGDADVNSGCTLTWGPGNLTAYPLLTADGRLLPTSPCIDAGDNAAVPSSVLTDLAGRPRISNGTVDMGAFELQGWPWLTITKDGEVVTLEWQAFGDGEYTVKWTDDLLSGIWQLASGQPLSELMWTDIVSGEVMQRFYRLESAGIYTDQVGFVKVFAVENGLTMLSVPLVPADNRLNGNPGCMGDILKEAVTGGAGAGDADVVFKWNAKTQSYMTAYVVAGVNPGLEGKWWDEETGTLSTMTLDVGECFWVLRRTRTGASP